MGVMSCSRKWCDNIMCDTYINGIGYICNECQSEFKEYLRIKEINPTTSLEIDEQLEIFMSTKKDSYNKQPKNQISVEDYFSQNTR